MGGNPMLGGERDGRKSMTFPHSRGPMISAKTQRCSELIHRAFRGIMQIGVNEDETEKNPE